jgi:hypothetical protein
MGAKRVIWHVGFERNLRRRGPPSFEVRSEVPLSKEPPRLDYLLLRVERVDVALGRHRLRRCRGCLAKHLAAEHRAPAEILDLPKKPVLFDPLEGEQLHQLIEDDGHPHIVVSHRRAVGTGG